MKYVSDKYAGTPDTRVEVPNGGSFADMAKLKGDKEIGEKINKIIRTLPGATNFDSLDALQCLQCDAHSCLATIQPASALTTSNLPAQTVGPRAAPFET
jgi:hypothetical protein